jgi:alpha-ketoglutarate-dependent taurine dioxygenase
MTLLADTVPQVSLLTSAIGAIVDGIDMREPLAAESVGGLRRSLLDHGVLFFRDQDVTAPELAAFAAHFGTPIPEPSREAYGGTYKELVTEMETAPVSKAVAERWHADATWLEEPPMATVLRSVRIPTVGGDTCWANMCAAYEDLSAGLRNMLDDFTAVHSMEASLEAMGAVAVRDAQVAFVHPVVRVHPETGRKALYVSEGWTTRIVELPSSQSAHILRLLFEHIRSPDFSVRWRWTPKDVAIWDNRSVQHYAVPDYDSDRVMQRLVLAGDRPYGPR